MSSLLNHDTIRLEEIHTENCVYSVKLSFNNTGHLLGLPITVSEAPEAPTIRLAPIEGCINGGRLARARARKLLHLTTSAEPQYP